MKSERSIARKILTGENREKGKQTRANVKTPQTTKTRRGENNEKPLPNIRNTNIMRIGRPARVLGEKTSSGGGDDQSPGAIRESVDARARRLDRRYYAAACSLQTVPYETETSAAAIYRPFD